jgi:hypothetical protein
MTALDQANVLIDQAIELLLAERQQIDERLAQLGHGDTNTAPMKKRGRPAKNATRQQAMELEGITTL